MSMTSHPAFSYLSSLSGMGVRLELGHIARLLGRLNHPERHYPSILIGGTNGKGSIAAMTASMLSAGGLRVGLYTSPHLIDIRERIRINGSMISPQEAIVCIDGIRNQLVEELTYFEFITAVAFLHFFQKKIDIAVLEVGMGGRLDATNVVEPVVSAISNISLEHTHYLGNRLDQITWEKAGIIKGEGICITAAKQKQVIVLLEDICRKKSAELYRVGKDIRVRMQPDGTMSYRGVQLDFHHLSCPLKGRHQQANAAVALGIIDALASKGICLDESAVTRGLKETCWEGRFELLQLSPALLVDSAHNPAGVSALCRTLQQETRYCRLIVVFGVLKDKSAPAMLRILASLADCIIMTKPDTDRAVSPKSLLRVAKKYLRHVEVIDDPLAAVNRAMGMAGDDDLICVTGSLYLVGTVKKAFPSTSDYANRSA